MSIGSPSRGAVLRTIVIILTVVTLKAERAVSGPNFDAKIALHIQALPTGKAPSICDRADYPPCNEGQDNLTVYSDSTSGSFDVYFLVLDGDSTDGISGAVFGIEYDGATGSGVDVNTWNLCATAEYPSEDWPGSGAGNTVTWSACQKTAAQGDNTGGVTAILGAAYISIYGTDTFAITRNGTLQRPPELAVSGCPGTDYIPYPRNAGSVAFGLKYGGYDPCKGPYSPYSVFQAMAQSDLDSLQLKLTYAGYEGKGRKASLVLSAAGHTPDMSLFSRLERPRIRYSNDEFAVQASASLQELSAIIDSIGTAPGLTAGTVDNMGYLSFSMVNTVNDTIRGYDTFIGPPDCRNLFGKLLSLLSSNETATSELLRLGCSSDCLPTDTPADVTSDMLVSADGFRLDHETNQFVTTVTVKNNGTGSVDSPLILIVRADPPARLMNAAGSTCRIQPGGPYAVLPVQTGLGQGESVKTTLRFYNPSSDPIKFDSWVYSGEGTR